MSGTPSTLDAAGPGAAEIAWLWWVMLALGLAVFVVVSVYLLIASSRQPSSDGPRVIVGGGQAFIAFWGIGVPAIVLTTLMVLNVVVGERTYAPRTEPELTVEVIGHEFWFEVRYPEHDIVTANEIHIPAGQPVAVEVTSTDVIHAFWVPQLHGKVDMIPGHVNAFWLQADEPGEFRGVCAEYCGIQHAQMHYVVVASPVEEFEAWVAARAEPPSEPDEGTAARGREVFVEANCVGCHTVRGVSPDTDAGPDLTDLATRRTIAAGTAPNTRENLREWILDPHERKPGVRMPPTALGDEDLEALLDYLESLAPAGHDPEEDA